MPVMTEIETRPEDVGHILVKVQDDLRQLRERLLAQGDGQSISVSDVEAALANTEKGLQRRTEEVVHHLDNRIQTFSLNGEYGQGMEPYTGIESTWDLKTNNRTDHINRSGYLSRDTMVRKPMMSSAMLPTKQPVQLQGLTPGQQMKQQRNLRAMFNPHNQQNRNVMQDNFGVQLPLIHTKKESKAPNKPVLGSTVEPLTVLPKANRVDAQLAPPPISEEDTQKGIMSLMERGLIPPAAQLTLDPSPVRQKSAPLHDPQKKNKTPAVSDMTGLYAGVRLDVIAKELENSDAIVKVPGAGQSRADSSELRKYYNHSRITSATSTNYAKTPVSMKTYEMPLQPMRLPPLQPPPTTPASGELKLMSHRFAIQHGRVRDNQPEFLAFKQHYCLSWGSIVTTIRQLEKMLSAYSVPIAFINGDRLADLSVEFELERPPFIEDLLTVIVNREDIESIIAKPGRKFLGQNGPVVAATCIQASWRRYVDRKQYLEYRRLKWAAGVIAISWIMHIKMAKVRKQLRQTRLDELERFKERAKKLAVNWDRISYNRRVIIHIPSLGLSQNIRDSIHDFGIRQNTQMGRLCDIHDPNVDVIFVSPVPLSDESYQYYSKLLGLKAAIGSGKVEDQEDVSDRYKIIIPEAIKSFPTHRMCLSTILKYSPIALQRIKRLIVGREALIVTGVPHKDDLSVADALNIPILAPEPDIAHLYSTKSGCKRIFASANVDMPHGEYDIYSLAQLHECLAQLVTENLNVKRWLFKLDDEFDGRGIATCDVTQFLECYKWALKESKRYGEKWSKKWAQEAAYIKILAEIPEILITYAQPANKKIYPTWSKYLEAFLSQGGVIEACPPSESITTLSADLLIEPSGNVRILTVGDQIHAESPLSCWGMSIPQSSIEPSIINSACFNIAEACRSRGIVGYMTVDFVTFINDKVEQKLWALDISLSYSDTLSIFQLLRYTTGGKLDTENHIFNIKPPIPDEKKVKPKRKTGSEEPPNTCRYAVMSTRLLHTNLAVVHYSVFFQMCRAHGIGFDIKEKQGTAFTLIDSFSRERLGMITIGDNLQGALAMFARNLSVIHQEISAPNMQGDTNFKGAIEDIEGILGTTIQNAEDQLTKET
ncbi:IQ domain-containing protein H isoform X1 [Patella vulgata]|uniref:IQ domain-containing protein H isoform X1 n=1 Tax=Patella vulgata TaxID=6465 RepID=UPI00218037C0|nr:IQ domain-containing protein H isoform X1 [Patella vulgata]